MTKHLILLTSLMSILLGVYFLTYRGVPISEDEAALFSATESLFKYGEPHLASIFYLYSHDPKIEGDPWHHPLHEPAHITLAVPLYAAAYFVDGIGLIHTVWLFNIFVTAATMGLFFLGGISLGYSNRTSWSTALVLGLGTMSWTYSQTNFREPLLAFWTLAAFLVALNFWRRRESRWLVGMGILLIFTVVMATLTKVVGALMLPALLFILIPEEIKGKQALQIFAGLSVLLILAFALILLTDPGQSLRFRYSTHIARFTNLDLQYTRTVFAGYFLSPGRSLWFTNPILILSLFGAWFSFKQGKWRFALAPFVLFLITAITYVWVGIDWHGGLGWGVRYLLPIVPTMGLLLLPIAEKLANRNWQIGFGLLFAFSFVIQLSAVLVPIETFYRVIDQKFPGQGLNAYYGEGLWQIQYTPWYIHLQNLDLSNTEIAWQFAEKSWIGIPVGVLLVIYGISAVFWKKKFAPVYGVVLPILVILGFGLGLHSLFYSDPRVFAERDDLQEIVEMLNERVQGDDVILLSDPEYRNFFLNYYKGNGLLSILRYSPGERYSWEQVPETGSPVLSLQVGVRNRWVLDYIPDHYEELWLVTNRSPFHEWSFRPEEHYMVRLHYPIEGRDTTPTARWIRFSLDDAPRDIPDIDESITFGEQIALTGYQIPQRVVSGGLLELSLKWEAIDSIDFDYNVGIFLMDENGIPVTEPRNRPPQDSFGKTSQWEIGIPFEDNHALVVPENLTAGTYEIQVILYDWRDVSRLPVLENGNAIEDDILTLGRVQVTQ